MSDTAVQDKLIMLERLLPGLDGAHQQRILGTSLETARQAISGAATNILTLERLTAFASYLAECFDPDSQANVRRLLSRLRAVGEKTAAATSQSELIELPIQWNMAKQDIDNLGLECRRAFKTLQRRQFGSVAPLGQLLIGFEADAAEKGRRLQTIGRGADALELPTDGSKVAQWDALRASKEQVFQELWQLGFSEDILLFLDAVLNGTATLGDVSSDILEWLRDRGAAAKFKVTL